VIPAVAEALRATTQPCTLLLIAPALLAVVATRGRWGPLGGVLVGAVAGGWLFIANVVALSEVQLRVSGVIAAAAVVVLLVADEVAWSGWARKDAVRSLLAGGLAFLGTLWWQPCVGDELGRILNGAARNGLAGELLDMAAYMLGAMTPVVVVALTIRAVDPGLRATVWIGTAAAFVAVMLGGALALGRHDELVATLTAWSH
jgi:cytochrome c biogenesis protein CcdA